MTSQPSMGAIVGSLGNKTDINMDSLLLLNDYWEVVRGNKHTETKRNQKEKKEKIEKHKEHKTRQKRKRGIKQILKWIVCCY